MAADDPRNRAHLLYMLPALAVVTPLAALLGLALGVGPAPGLLRVCMVFLFVSPATGFLGLRTLARVGGAAPASVHRTARIWCFAAFLTPFVLWFSLQHLARS